MTDTRPAGGELALGQDAQDLLFRTARSANSFTDEPVGEDTIRAIHDLVKWAPTSMNQQPLRVTLLRSAESRQRLLPHLSEGNREKTRKAPLTAILTADTDFHEHLPTQFPHAPGVKDLFAEAGPREDSARLNATLQVGYFILGVRAAGLAVGPMTGMDVAGVEREFFPDGDRRALVVVNIGRPGPDAWFDRLPRLSYEQVVDTR